MSWARLMERWVARPVAGDSKKPETRSEAACDQRIRLDSTAKTVLESYLTS